MPGKPEKRGRDAYMRSGPSSEARRRVARDIFRLSHALGRADAEQAEADRQVVAHRATEPQARRAASGLFGVDNGALLVKRGERRRELEKIGRELVGSELIRDGVHRGFELEK